MENAIDSRPEGRQFPYQTTLTTSQGDVQVSIDAGWEGCDPEDLNLQFYYEGAPDALIACGASTAELMARGPQGRRKVDADGDSYHREHGRKSTCVRRTKPFSSAGTREMPGFEPWMRDGAAKRVSEELQGRKNLEMQQERERNPPLAPDAWREKHRSAAWRCFDLMIGSLIGSLDSTSDLLPEYKLNEADFAAIIARAKKARGELHDLIVDMRIERRVERPKLRVIQGGVA